MANQKPNGQDSGVDPMLMLAACGLIAAFAYLFWSRFHTNIATAYSWVRVAQFSPFLVIHSVWAAGIGGALFVGGFAAWIAKKSYAKYGLWAFVAGAFILAGYLVGDVFVSWFGFFKESDKAAIEWGHLSKSSLYANLFTLVVGIVPLAIWMIRRSLGTNPTNHKHYAKGKDYTLHTFTDTMAKHYPHLKLFRKLNLTERPINSGKYRMADTEKQFAIKHDLLDHIKGNEFKVNRDRTAQVFVNQMTKLWTGYNGLSRWEQAVIAVLVSRIAATDPAMSDKDYKAALDRTDELLRGYWKDAAASYDVKSDTLKLNLTLARDTIKKYGQSAKVKHYFKAHAYVGTVMYAMLLEARTLGVLQPAELRWLRVVDRRLWLIIDNVGKIVSTTEVGATYAHFLHEVKQKRGIEKPMIDGAVRGLIEAVESFAFSQDEVKEIESLIASKKAALRIEVAPKEQLTVIVMALTIGTGQKRELYDVAVIKESGEELYRGRARNAHPVDLEARERYQLDDAAVLAMSSLPTADDVRKAALAACNGHNVVTFDKAGISLLQGLDLSAESIVECRGDESFNLEGAAVMEGVVEEHELKPIRDAVAAAQLCRVIWLAQQKAALKAQVKAA